MKAIDIIKAMTYDSNLAEYADVWIYDEIWPDETPGEWIKRMFGDFHVKAGTITVGTYLCVWSINGNDIYPFRTENAPDILLERNNLEDASEDDREVWLWRIE